MLSFIVSLFFIRHEDVDPDFNITIWKEQNVDFYVPPHPLLYLVTFKPIHFVLVTMINYWAPPDLSHAIQTSLVPVFLIITPIFQFMTQTAGLGQFIFLSVHVIFKVFDIYAWIDVVAQVGELLTENTTLLWFFNYMYFGIFATWPIIRPDYYDYYKETYCMYWSC
jgi:hypothetical protein